MYVVESGTGSLEKGIRLFNEGRYFEAHAAWEDLWLDEKNGDEKKFLHGLLMAASSFHHYVRGECSGAIALLIKSIPLLESGLNDHPNLRLFDFIGCSISGTAESLPKIARMFVYC